MIKKEFIDYLAEKTKIKQKELIEKDLILHMLLYELTKFPFFRENFVFKGGTCLIKCYLGYYRFSEDLDFTWIKQDVFRNKSEKQIRKQLSFEVNRLMELLNGICTRINLEFKLDKQNNRYVEFGGSNKFVTFKLWYNSSLLDMGQFVKIQINFVELFKYPFKEISVRNIVENISRKEIEFLFPEYAAVFSAKPLLKIYDPKEILIEKIRAILTRRGIKERDYVDIFLISIKLRINPQKYKKEIIAKVKFMLRYGKYLQNLQDKKETGFKFRLGEEKRLLLVPLEEDFTLFVQNFDGFLNSLVLEILGERLE